MDLLLAAAKFLEFDYPLVLIVFFGIAALQLKNRREIGRAHV